MDVDFVTIYVYFKNGNVDMYEVESIFKAREHAEKIWAQGYRMRLGDRMEWFGPHWIDKICWDMPTEDYLSEKYETRKIKSNIITDEDGEVEIESPSGME